MTDLQYPMLPEGATRYASGAYDEIGAQLCTRDGMRAMAEEVLEILEEYL